VTATCESCTLTGAVLTNVSDERLNVTVSPGTYNAASTRKLPRMATTRIQFSSSRVRSMRRPTDRMTTHNRNVATPMK